MPWDPFDRCQGEVRLLWGAVALWLLILRGPAFVENLCVKEIVPDFFQDYASARNTLEGLPVYTSLDATIPRYLGQQRDTDRSLVVFNAHPPTSILLALPLAKLDFQTSLLAWNLLSLVALAGCLWIIFRLLEVRLSAVALCSTLAALLLCHPLWEGIRLGQLSLILALLLTGTWSAERSGRPALAGATLGVATAIKLFPGFLLLYYAWRREWRVVAAGSLTLSLLTGLTALVLGVMAYTDYFLTVLPHIYWFRVAWNNASIAGFWCRLFDPEPGMAQQIWLTDPLCYSARAAAVGYWLSSLVVLCLLARATRRVKTQEDGDRAFALATTAMLLISPITWSHYFLVLLAPLAVLWHRLTPGVGARAAFISIVVALWLGPSLVWTVFDVGGRVAEPLDSVGVLSYQFYALVGLFLLGLLQMRSTSRRRQA